MSGINAKRLEHITDNVTKWYMRKRQLLIAALEADGYPYGSVKLSPTEQYSRYKSMTQADWQQLTEALYTRFRGLPDASAKVASEITKFRGQMQNLDRQFGGQSKLSSR